MASNWFRFAAPASFYPLAGRLIPVFWILTGVCLLVGLYWGFFQTPDQLGGSNAQKEYYRIIFIHVPAAWMSMWLYVVMVGWAAIGLVFNTRLSFMMANAIAPTGAIFTFLALWTGAFWGRPSWGTYWDWDPRLTTELIL
ncbi:MAG: heme ABC transporter permease, partial [Gammaproteobacteria bacterium]|nr:heme ABC transporter permease [Gammaproteobacteria bacterium]